MSINLFPTLTEIDRAVVEGRIAADDWVIWGTDEALRTVARCDVPEGLKTLLLPARSAEGLTILGSKCGLAQLANHHGLTHPRSSIAGDGAELAPTLSRSEGPVIIKADIGSGGRRLRVVEQGGDDHRDEIPDSWFPVVVQEFIAGPPISVEALFREGQLVRFTYSTARQFSNAYGPSSFRHFHAPPRDDFISTLERLGQLAQLHGFANCSFLWNDEASQHFLIEADMRPNLWHQFGPALGVSWAEGMLPPAPGTPPPAWQQQDAHIRLFPRAVIDALSSGEPSLLTPWLRNDPSTWRWRQHQDSTVNIFEYRLIAQKLFHSLMSPHS